MVAHLRFAHGISTSFLPRFGLFKVVVSSLLNLSINERGGAAAPSAPPLATSLGSKHETSRDDDSNAAATANGKLPNDDAAATAANANAAATTE